MKQILIESIASICVMIITMIFERYRYLNWIFHLKGEDFVKELDKALYEKRLPQNHINNRLYLFWWAIKTFYV